MPSPCSSPRRAQGRLREKQGKERYRPVGEPGGQGDEIVPGRPYRGLGSGDSGLCCMEIKEEQNEYEPISWGVVRNIKSWDC